MVNIPDTIGIVGVGLMLLAYFLLQAGRVTVLHLAYPLLNLVGALLHLYSLFYAWNWASVIIEVFWIAISLYGLWRAVRARQADPSISSSS